MKSKTYFIVYDTNHSGPQALIKTKKEAENIASDPDNMNIFALMTTDPVKFKDLQSVDYNCFTEIKQSAKPWEITNVNAKIVKSELKLFKK